jgi:hypothetical protein
MVVSTMILLYLAVGVVLPAKYYPCDFLEFRLIDFAGELEIILELRDLLVLVPERVARCDYSAKVALSLLCQQDQFPLLGVAHHLRYIYSHPTLGLCPRQPLDHLSPFPLRPDQVAGVRFVLAAKGPPGPRLEDAFDEQSVVALANEGAVLQVGLRVD